MRVFDRDLIRGGHYGQRSCEPHLQAEHMAAPTNAANVKKALANGEPSTHGTSRKSSFPGPTTAYRTKADSSKLTEDLLISSCPGVRFWARRILATAAKLQGRDGTS